jgi:hypothetical protein
MPDILAMLGVTFTILFLGIIVWGIYEYMRGFQA